jgi:hypothetical protein
MNWHRILFYAVRQLYLTLSESYRIGEIVLRKKRDDTNNRLPAPKKTIEKMSSKNMKRKRTLGKNQMQTALFS